MNFTKTTYPCSCEKVKEEDNQLIVKKGFCESNNSTQGENNPEEWPVYPEVCVGLAARSWTLPPWEGQAFQLLDVSGLSLRPPSLASPLLPICSHQHLQGDEGVCLRDSPGQACCSCAPWLT